MARLAIADFSFSTWWRGDAMGTRRRAALPRNSRVNFPGKAYWEPVPFAEPNHELEHRSNGMTNAAKNKIPKQ